MRKIFFSIIIFIFTIQNLSQAGYPKVGVPKLGNLPAIDEIRSKKRIEGRLIKVLVTGFVEGSSFNL